MLVDERSIFETFVSNFHSRFDKLEQAQILFERHHTETHKQVKEELESIKQCIKERDKEISNSIEQMKTTVMCRQEECSKKFLPRWLLNLTIGAIIFIGGVVAANRWWIVRHDTIYETTIKGHILKEDITK